MLPQWIPFEIFVDFIIRLNLLTSALWILFQNMIASVCVSLNAENTSEAIEKCFFSLLEWRKWKLSKLSKRKQDVYAAHEADFLRTFFCKLFDCHCVLASSFLLFNKCITTARLALSHREKKMLYNAKIQNISLIYINKLKNLWLLSAFTVISVNNFCRWSSDKSSILSVNQYQFILWHRKTTSLWSFRECFKSSNVFSW